jgi:pilus assembly protein CpaC
MLAKRTSLIAIILLAAATLWPAPAPAQTDPSASSPLSGRLTVEMNEGRLVRLPTPASSVFIANPEIADVNVKSARMIYVFGKTPGQTTLFAVDRNENVVANVQVVIEHNIGRLQENIDRLLPAGGVKASSVAGGIILSGSVATAIDAENVRRLAVRFIGKGEEVINQLRVTEPTQVNLRVRIAEVSRQVLNRFGFNWDALYSTGSFLIGFSTFNSTLESSALLSPSYNNGTFNVNALVDALADDGLITVLAEPNLTALSGETASFLAGGEFPIPVSEDDGVVTIVFKEFGVSLAFTPTIVGESRISLRVKPEVSQLTNAGAVTIGSVQVPGLTTRRAETTVELASGQSFAIAGLLLSDSQELIKKTPGLGDLPILGALFKSERFERNETELVIVVTPYLVEPASDVEVTLPTDPYYKSASKAEATKPVAQSRVIPLSGSATANRDARATGYLLD